MGRPSLANERTSQILDAFESCIRKHGLKESSIPRIAEEAGVKHSLIRHYIGNRDSLIAAMVNRFTEHYLEIILKALSSRPEGVHIDSTVKYFFDEVSRFEAENLIFTELFAASGRDEFIKAQLCSLYGRITDMIISLLSLEYPDSKPDEISTVAYSLLSLWIGHSTLFHLDFGTSGIEMAATSAKQIISGLGSLK